MYGKIRLHISYTTMVQQAQKLGAKTFVHYYRPQDLTYRGYFAYPRLNLVREECENLGIKFVEEEINNPQSSENYVGLDYVQQFIPEDVPKKIEEYGKDTAFFITCCGAQDELTKAVAKTGGIFPQPCCPSLYHDIMVSVML